MAVISEGLGHTSEKTTRIYLDELKPNASTTPTGSFIKKSYGSLMMKKIRIPDFHAQSGSNFQDLLPFDRRLGIIDFDEDSKI